MTAIVTVDGRVSSPEIQFSSEPPLPQDEVLARVLFNRATQNLSAFQLAQLAAAAAELAGGGGPGIMSQLRGATGLDDLDIITEEDGSTAVRAGKYLDENIYLDVQTDTDGRDPRRDQPRRQRQRHRPRLGRLGRQHHASASSTSATTDVPVTARRRARNRPLTPARAVAQSSRAKYSV